LPSSLKNLVLIVCILGGLIGYLVRSVSINFFNKSLNNYLFSFFGSSMWFIPLVSTVGVIFFPLDLGSKAVKRFDQG
jgi:NADH-ubiquinone oxidoreductase chain 5